MLMTAQYNHDRFGEPEACFPTDTEIQIADQLRHQLEERYLGAIAHGLPKAERSTEGG